MTEPSAASSVDALWEQLAPHVEWPEGFSLVFLFAGHPRPVGELRDKLAQSVQQRAKTLKILEPETAQAVAELTPSVIMAPGAECGAMWISLLRRAGTQAWTIAVRELLQRLNERRFLLERDVAVPVVIVLPLELRSDAYVLAPDLWTVRSFTAQVPASEMEALRVTIDNRGASIGQQLIVSGNATFGHFEINAPVLPDPRGRAEVEWVRLLVTGDLRKLSAADGFAAYDSAHERGDLQAARRIAKQTLAVVLSQVGVEVEDVDELDVTEALRDADLGDARIRRDVATTLEELSRVEMAEEHLEAARMLLRRALDLRETLVEMDPLDARAQQDLCASLQGFGEVEMKAGNLDSARDAFLRAAELTTSLASSNPHDDRLRRESINPWAKLGELEARARNFTAARAYNLRMSELHEAAARASPNDVKPHLAWSSSLGALGFVEMLAGNIAAARDYFRRRVEIAEATASTHPNSAQPQHELGEALTSLSVAEAEAGNLVVARERLDRALAIYQGLAKANPTDTNARLKVARAHRDLADLARRQQDQAAALDHLRHAADTLDALEASGQVSVDERENLREDVMRRLASMAAG